MKIGKEFVLRKIADEYVLVPAGSTAISFNGLITLNDTGVFLWNNLKTDCSQKQLVQSLLEEYEVDEATAQSDVQEFINKLKEHDILSQ